MVEKAFITRTQVIQSFFAIGCSEDAVLRTPAIAHDPDLASSIRQNIENWHFASGLVEPIMEGLGKAGLKVAPSDDALGTAVARSVARKTVGIAVLPFSDLSPAKDQDYFCEGMAEEIMNALVHVEGKPGDGRELPELFRQ